MAAKGISIPYIALYDNYFSYDNDSNATSAGEDALSKNAFAWYGANTGNTVPGWID